VLPDEIQLVGDVGVNAGIVGLCASDSPGDDAEQSGFAVDDLDQRTAAVALATVDTAIHEAGAGHGFGDHFLVEEIGVLAGVPFDEWDGGGAENGGRSAGFFLINAFWVHLAPAGNQSRSAGLIQTGGVGGNIIWETRRLDEFVERHRSAQFNESNVVAHLLLAIADPFRMDDDSADVVTSGFLVEFLQVVATNHDLVASGFGSSDDAVSGSDDPLVADNSSTADVLRLAEQPIVIFEANLVRISSFERGDAADDPLLHLVEMLIVESLAAFRGSRCGNSSRQGGEKQKPVHGSESNQGRCR